MVSSPVPQKEFVEERAGSDVALPRHVGIIMDGNGRWAEARGLPRSEGHRRGIAAVRRAVAAARDRGIEYLTLFGFSSENWSRPPEEVDFLLSLLRLFIRRDLVDLHQQGVRVRVIGGRDRLPSDIRTMIDEAERLTASNDRLHLIVAFNYGSRNEIASAVHRIVGKVQAGELDARTVNEATVSEHLDTTTMPDPDLVIRTGGEQRLSNFLLWQSAYAELVFLPLHWPDFDAVAFDIAIDEYMTRIRRYGGLVARNSA
jgi:undecaprenyl diphosphate synthase